MTWEKILKEVIRSLSIFILFLPLLVLRTTLFPYIFPKIIFFQIAVEIIFGLWLILIIQKKEYRPNFKNPLLLSLTIFLGILILTSLLGMDPIRSFFSTQERMTGVITLFHFYLWFLVLITLFKEISDWRKFIWGSLLASFLVGLYGLGQKFGFEFLLKGDALRLSATLGNPIYLSVYAMLHAFLAGFLILQERKKILKALLIILILFNLGIMLLGASRGVFFAFSVSLFLFFVFLVILVPSKKIKVLASLILILIISGFIFLKAPKAQPFIEKLPVFLRRILSTTPTTLLTTDWTRISAWQIALEGFKEKPILGWGWKNFNLIFNKYYHPRYLEGGFSETWFDKSHNQLLDILCLTGIFGLISYLTFFFFIFKGLFKKSREYRVPFGSLILGLMMLSYFLQNLSVFDTPAPLISFYLSLGLIYFCSQSEPHKQIQGVGAQSQKFSQIPRAERRRRALKKKAIDKNAILIPIILISLSLTIYKLNILPFSKSQDGAKGAVISPIHFESGLYFYKNSLKGSSFTHPEIRLMLAKTVLEEGEKLDEKTKREALEFAISEMEKNIKEHPFDVKYHLTLGKLNMANSNLEKAEDSFKKALELSPKRQEIYYELGQVKISEKKFPKALEFYEEALKLNEKVRDSHWYYGLAQILNENYEEGIKEIELAENLGFGYGNNPDAHLIIAYGYGEIGNFGKAIFFCDLALNLEPENPKALSLKALFLAQSGKKEEALKILENLAEIDKSLAKELLKVIQ